MREGSSLSSHFCINADDNDCYEKGILRLIPAKLQSRNMNQCVVSEHPIFHKMDLLNCRLLGNHIQFHCWEQGLEHAHWLTLPQEIIPTTCTMIFCFAEHDFLFMGLIFNAWFATDERWVCMIAITITLGIDICYRRCTDINSFKMIFSSLLFV